MASWGKVTLRALSGTLHTRAKASPSGQNCQLSFHLICFIVCSSLYQSSAMTTAAKSGENMPVPARAQIRGSRSASRKVSKGSPFS